MTTVTDFYEVLGFFTYFGFSILLAILTSAVPGFVYYTCKTRNNSLYRDEKAYKISVIISIPVTLLYLIYTIVMGRMIDMIHFIMWIIIIVRIIVLFVIVFWVILTTDF